jgi:hypothetical protein
MEQCNCREAYAKPGKESYTGNHSHSKSWLIIDQGFYLIHFKAAKSNEQYPSRKEISPFPTLFM